MNISNFTNHSDYSYSFENPACYEAYGLYTQVISKIISSVGIVLNFLNIVVFLNPRMKTTRCSDKNKMNVYLLAKSACDLTFLTRNIFFYLLDCQDCSLASHKGLKIFHLVFSVYLGIVSQLASMLLAVMATFDRYVTISQTCCQVYAKISYLFVLASIFAFSCLFYSYKFFEYHVVPTIKAESYGSSEYSIDYTSFGNSPTMGVIRVVHSFMRDFVCVVLLVILNVLITLKMRTNLHKKKAAAAILRTSAPALLRTVRAEHKVTIMVILTASAAIIGHILPFLSYLPLDILLFTQSFCFAIVELLVYFSSFSIDFVFCFFFNSFFRKTFFVICRSMLRRIGISESERRSSSFVSSNNLQAALSKL